MKVKLIQITDNPIDVMWTAARTCYNPGSPIDMWETRYPENIDLLDGYDNGEKEEIVNKHWNLVKKVLDSGHQSIAEHVYFTFAIEGISRACSHQLVRHRAGIVFSQQSQRYVEIKENANKLNELLENYKRYNDFTNEQDLRKVVEKYFVIPSEIDYKFLGTDTNDSLVYLADALLSYLILLERGTKAEDARQVLPNATKTNIVMSCNYRELIHLCNLRLCTRAQLEIRNLFKEIKKVVANKDVHLGDLLVPKCERYGFCTEAKCCGRRPRLKDVMEDYSSYQKVKLDMKKAKEEYSKQEE